MERKKYVFQFRDYPTLVLIGTPLAVTRMAFEEVREIIMPGLGETIASAESEVYSELVNKQKAKIVVKWKDEETGKVETEYAIIELLDDPNIVLHGWDVREEEEE